MIRTFQWEEGWPCDVQANQAVGLQFDGIGQSNERAEQTGGKDLSQSPGYKER
jgi:hypothetical protein